MDSKFCLLPEPTVLPVSYSLTGEAVKAGSCFSQPSLQLAVVRWHRSGQWGLTGICWVASGKTFCCLDKRDGATIFPLYCLEHCLRVTMRQCTWRKGQENDIYSDSNNFKSQNQHLHQPTSGLLGMRKNNPYLSHSNLDFLILKTFITDTFIYSLLGLNETHVRWEATYLKIDLVTRDPKKPVN